MNPYASPQPEPPDNEPVLATAVERYSRVSIAFFGTLYWAGGVMFGTGTVIYMTAANEREFGAGVALMLLGCLVLFELPSELTVTKTD